MQGTRAIALLNGVLWDRNINNHNKKQIYDTIVKSITTYGCEVWKLKEKNKTKVKSHRDGLLEESAGKSRLERVTNESEKYGSYTYNNRRTLNLYGTGKNAEN